ncbi:MAG: hypothetical protein WA055_03000 [Candidatus Moraniibacteriota bacterium]
MDSLAEKLQAYEKAMKEAGCTPKEKINFVKTNGHSLENCISDGGWAMTLVNMVPSMYKTYEELAQAIKTAP